ncbi:MAG TPA: cytochrome c peroxidase [Polyangiaceae bacterium]|nr:cytochrome c peroxidase [Polyangiaceae bacterium]
MRFELAFVSCALAAAACDAAAPAPTLPAAPALSAALPAIESPAAGRDDLLSALPPAPSVDPQRSALGMKLFDTASLSTDGSVSCSTCHPLARAGADGLVHSRGANGHETTLNTPTIYNVSFNFRFNWNGAYTRLEDALDAPIALTLGTTWSAIEEQLRAQPEWRMAFDAAYRDGVTTANIKDALARYIDTLTTPDARFDQFWRGDTDALTNEERRGYETFEALGCSTCHQGANVGGNMFQRLGVMHDYFQARVEHGGPAPSAADLGRYQTTQQHADRHVFRVPSLRNVALTPPYFHDGSEPTLELAVAEMGYVQLGKRLSDEEVSLLVAFLKTLTGPAAQSPRRGTGS